MASPARQELLNDGRDATLDCRDGRLHQAGRWSEVDDEEEEEKGQRTKGRQRIEGVGRRSCGARRSPMRGMGWEWGDVR